MGAWEEAAMAYEFTAVEAATLPEALKIVVSDRRAELAKSEKHGWIEALHREEQVLDGVLGKKTGCAP